MGAKELTSTVRILGEPFRIRGGDPEQVARLAQFVDDKLSEIRSRNENLPLRNLLILASLNIAEDLFRERKEHEDLFGETILPGEDYLKRKTGPAWDNSVKLSQLSVERVFLSIFDDNPELRKLA